MLRRRPVVDQRLLRGQRRLIPGSLEGRSEQAQPPPSRPKGSVYRPPARSEVAPFSQYGAVTLTTAADAPAWIVGQGGGTGGFIDAATLYLSTAGSTSTVVTIYVNGVSIGTVTYASGDTTPQTDALTATRVAVGARVTARVTTAGTGAKGLSAFVPIGVTT